MLKSSPSGSITCSCRTGSTLPWSKDVLASTTRSVMGSDMASTLTMTLWGSCYVNRSCILSGTRTAYLLTWRPNGAISWNTSDEMG